MNLLDCLLMTLFNAGICIALPKVISLIGQEKANSSKTTQPNYAP